MVREERFKGKTKEELQAMKLGEFAELVPASLRRSLKRGFTPEQKKLVAKLQKAKQNPRLRIKTHCRNMVIIPDMIGSLINVHSGKDFQPVEITVEKLGHRLGDFVMTRGRIKHSKPGIGATKSSAAASVK